MATLETLRMDVKGLLAEATRSGKAAVSRKLGEAEFNGHDHADPTILLLGAVEVEGGRLIGSMIPSYRAVAGFDKVRGSAARVVLRKALEGYLAQSARWAPLHPAFSGHQPERLDQDFEPMRARLRGKLEQEAGLVDSAPRPSAWRRYRPALVVLLVALATALGVWALYFRHG